MAVTLSSLAGAGAQFFDNNGVPLAGGLIYTYLAGTSTPAATYTSSTGLIAHANPIVLNAAGRIVTGEVWLTTGVEYKFVVQTSLFVQIGSYDNIPSINDFTNIYAALANTTDVTLGDALIGFKQSNSSGALSGAVGRTVHQKLQEIITVKDFGAVGNGIVDDTIAINAAIDASISNNLTLNWNAGTYKVTDTIYPQGAPGGAPPATAPYWVAMDGPNTVTISGASFTSAKSIIEWDGGAGQAGHFDAWMIEGFTIVGNSTYTTGVAIIGGGSIRVKKCHLLTHLVGVEFSNDKPNYYTEQCLIQDSFFENDVFTHVKFTRGVGDQSFRGTGILNCFHNVDNNVVVMDIGTECLPYNSPIDTDISYNGDGTQPIIKTGSNLSFTPTFVGNIRLENFQYPTYIPKIVDGSASVFLCGVVQSLTGSFLFEKLFLASYASRAVNGSGNLLADEAKTKLLPRTEKFTLLAGSSGTQILPFSNKYLSIFGPLLVSLSFLKNDGAKYTTTLYAQTDGTGGGLGVVWDKLDQVVFGANFTATISSYVIAADFLTMIYDYSLLADNVNVYVTYTPLWAAT
jgi:hypothetical protein